MRAEGESRATLRKKQACCFSYMPSCKKRSSDRLVLSTGLTDLPGLSCCGSTSSTHVLVIWFIQENVVWTRLPKNQQGTVFASLTMPNSKFLLEGLKSVNEMGLILLWEPKLNTHLQCSFVAAFKGSFLLPQS